MKPLVLIFALCGLLVLPAFAEKQAFERYQSIVDRQMFGPLPPDFDPTKSPSEVQKSSSAQDKELTKEQEQLKSAVHFSVLDVRPNGDVLVGFTDNTDPKVPRNYFLKVGDSRDGWTVKEADPDAATMTIVKDEIEVSLSLGGNSAKGAGTTARAGASGEAGATRRSSLLGGSLSSRRFQRRQALAEEQAKAEAEKAAAAAREAERQQQAEAEKAQREAEQTEQRQQLQAIREELKRAREARAAAEAAAAAKGSESAESSGGAEN